TPPWRPSRASCREIACSSPPALRRPRGRSPPRRSRRGTRCRVAFAQDTAHLNNVQEFLAQCSSRRYLRLERCSSQEDEMSHQWLGDLVEAKGNELGIPGVAVGVWGDGRELHAFHGVTSVENPLPVDPETLFVLGSVTKTFTATAVMRLVG